MKSNITIEDIKGIEVKSGMRLSEEQRDAILNEYNRVVLDKGESWSVIIENLIIGIS